MGNCHPRLAELSWFNDNFLLFLDDEKTTVSSKIEGIQVTLVGFVVISKFRPLIFFEVLECKHHRKKVRNAHYF